MRRGATSRRDALGRLGGGEPGAVDRRDDQPPSIRLTVSATGRTGIAAPWSAAAAATRLDQRRA